MSRTLTALLSAMSVVAGFIIIAGAHSRDLVCAVAILPYTGRAMSPQCASVASLYFLGFALVVGGLMFALVALVALDRHDGYHYRGHGPRRHER